MEDAVINHHSDPTKVQWEPISILAYLRQEIRLRHYTARSCVQDNLMELAYKMYGDQPAFYASEQDCRDSYDAVQSEDMALNHSATFPDHEGAVLPDDDFSERKIRYYRGKNNDASFDRKDYGKDYESDSSGFDQYDGDYEYDHHDVIIPANAMPTDFDPDSFALARTQRTIRKWSESAKKAKEMVMHCNELWDAGLCALPHYIFYGNKQHPPTYIPETVLSRVRAAFSGEDKPTIERMMDHADALWNHGFEVASKVILFDELDGYLESYAAHENVEIIHDPKHRRRNGYGEPISRVEGGVWLG